jgi:hypothetical protein
MIDYVNTIIYKISCKDETIKECYVGHTTNFKQRKIEHKYACCNKNCKSYNSKVYSFIRNNGGFDNWHFVEIEQFPCTSKVEAQMRENYWYFIFKAVLNTISPSLDLERRQIQINRKKVIGQLKRKFADKRGIIKREREKYLKDNAEQIKEDKKKIRIEYCEKNRDKINARMREYNKTPKQQEYIKNYNAKREAKKAEQSSASIHDKE